MSTIRGVVGAAIVGAILAGCSAPEMIPLYGDPTAGAGADIPAALEVSEPQRPSARVEPQNEGDGRAGAGENRQAEPQEESEGALRRITEPGCCAEPFWSTDGEMVLYIDRPQGTAAGVYGVDAAGGEPELIDEVVGKIGGEGRYRIRLVESATTIDNLETGETWEVEAAEGREVHIAPGGDRLAWADTQEVGAYNQRLTTISVAALDGSGARDVITVVGGNLIGWLDGERLLITGRPRGEEGERTLFALGVDDGVRTILADTSRAHPVAVAPGGEWVFYGVAFDPEDTAQAGMWVVSADGETRREIPVVGSAQWRDDHRLVIVPMEVGAESNRLVEYDVETGEITELTDPEETAFRILAGDWKIAPGGERIAFVSAEDEAIWVLEIEG